MSPALTKVKWLLTLAAMVLFGALGLTYTDRLPWVLDGVGIFSDQARI